jgi:hypothetical protein
MNEKRLGIRIITQYDGKGAGQAEQSVKGLSGALGNLGKISAAVGGAGLLLKIGRDAIQTASNIEEMQSKFNVVFGSSGDSVTSQLEQFGEQANRSLYDLQGFAASFQDTFVPLGFAREQAAELSVGLTKLTEDLASFNNLASSDVAANLSSALVGNHEAVRSFGIVITETTLKAELAANGWDNLTGAALEQAKVQARLNIIMRSTTDAQGDAIRTSDSYANQVRGMQAAWQEFLATLGTAALPVATAAVQNLAEAARQVSTDIKPSIAALTGEYGNAVEEMIADNIQGAKTLEDLAAEGAKLSSTYNMLGGFAGHVTGTHHQMREGILATGRAMAAQAGSFGEFETAVSSFTGVARREFELYVETLGMTVEEYYNLVHAAAAVESSDKAMLTAAQNVGYQMEQNSETLATGSGMAQMYADKAIAADEASRKFAIGLEQQRLATIAANTALVSAFNATAEPVQAFLAAQQQSLDAQGEWVTYTRNNAGEIADISEQLAADLTEDQRTAWEETLKNTTEGSAEWLTAWKALQADLTATQRAELIAQRADLEAAGETVGSAYTGSIEDMQAAKDAAIEANNAIIASYQQLALEGSLALAEASPDPEALQRTLDYAVAIGAMSQAEADLRLEAANTRLEIEALNQKVVEGSITTADAAVMYDELTSSQGRAADASGRLTEEGAKIGAGFLESLPGIDQVIERLNALDGRHVRTTVETNYVSTGEPGKAAGGDKDEEVGSTTGGGGRAFGGLVYPNRLYTVGERGPEVFMPSTAGHIIPNHKLGGLDMGSINVNGPLIGTVIQQPGESATELANRISQILAKRSRQIRVAGG